jgi:signal peptidase I
LALRGYGDVELGSDEYFLLGDNRNESLDSRIFGPVKRDLIVGRTWIRGWPFNRVTVFNTPEYK